MTHSNTRTCAALILAAGEGTRMNSALPKVMHKVAGLEMVNHVVGAALGAGVDLCAVVTGNGREVVEAGVVHYHDKVEFFEQHEQSGTANAVLAAKDALARGYDDILVLFGDTPLLKSETLTLMRKCLSDGADVAVLGFYCDNPDGYGRLLEKDGRLVAIREHKEANAKEREVNFCNGGIMAINGAKCLELVSAVTNDNARGEYYLTDIAEIAHQQGLNVVAQRGDEEEILGINTRVELAEAEALWQQRKRRELMLAGVTMIAPESVYLSHDTQIGRESMLEPGQVFGPGVTIGERVNIRAWCHFEQCEVDNECDIGPYARLRPLAKLSRGARVGNFVEIKKSNIGPGAKVNHLSYIGDADIGENANIGAGTITCNYDGVNKHRTSIEAGVFVGSNSALVAPVTIGKSAYVGSGSVITKDVPEDALVVSRARQTIFEGRARLLKKKALVFKAKKSASE